MGKILSRLRHAATGRLDDVYVDPYDGAYRLTDRGFGERVYLDDYVSATPSEPPPAAAGDGPREVLASAGAQEGHGWSVSATRVIGNPPSEAWGRFVDDLYSPGSHWERYMRELREYAATLGPLAYRPQLTAEALDAVRVEPVMPDAIEAPPSPGPCPSPGCYGRQRRERGEVRTSLWRCGCAVRPESSSYCQRRDDESCRGELVWWASGHGATAYHPTEAGAIAAWREALAQAQRKEDAA